MEIISNTTLKEELKKKLSEYISHNFSFSQKICEDAYQFMKVNKVLDMFCRKEMANLLQLKFIAAMLSNQSNSGYLYGIEEKEKSVEIILHASHFCCCAYDPSGTLTIYDSIANYSKSNNIERVLLVCVFFFAFFRIVSSENLNFQLSEKVPIYQKFHIQLLWTTKRIARNQKIHGMRDSCTLQSFVGVT